MLLFERDYMWSFLAAGVHIGKVMVDTSAAPKKQHTDNCLGPKRAPAPSQNGHEVVPSLAPLRLEPALFFR